MKHLRLLFIPALLLLLAACVDPPPAQNLAPVAVITTDTPEGYVEVGTTVALDGSNSDDPDGVITTYDWFLNGEEHHRGKTTTVTLDTLGANTIELVVTDNRDLPGSASVTYNVLAVGHEPDPEPFPTQGVRIHDISGMDPETTPIDINFGEEPMMLIEVYEAWSLSTDVDWLSFDRPAGSTPEYGEGGPNAILLVELIIDDAYLQDADDANEATITLAATESDAKDIATFTLHLPSFEGPIDHPTPLRKAVGRSDFTTITVTSAGAHAPLDFTATPSDDWLTVDDPLPRLGAGSSQNLKVTAECREAGHQSGEITLTSNDPRHPDGTKVDVTIECLEKPESDFSIHLDFTNAPELTDDQKERAWSAAHRWSEVILGDLGPAPSSRPDGVCHRPELTFSDLQDDIWIFVEVATLLPSGGESTPPDATGVPCEDAIRDPGILNGGLPYAGVVQINTDYLGRTDDLFQFENLVIHEIGHVLGIGTLWIKELGLVNDDGSYAGEHASEQYRAYLEDSGSPDPEASPPLEAGGGDGTVGAHWAQATFGDELMTGYANEGDRMPLSKVTIGALEDLGYNVTYELADTYALPTADITPFDSLQGLNLKGDTIR